MTPTDLEWLESLDAPPPTMTKKESAVTEHLCDWSNNLVDLCGFPQSRKVSLGLLRTVWDLSRQEFSRKPPHRRRLAATQYLHCVARAKQWLEMLRTGKGAKGLPFTDLLPEDHPCHGMRRSTYGEVAARVKDGVHNPYYEPPGCVINLYKEDG